MDGRVFFRLAFWLAAGSGPPLKPRDQLVDVAASVWIAVARDAARSRAVTTRGQGSRGPLVSGWGCAGAGLSVGVWRVAQAAWAAHWPRVVVFRRSRRQPGDHGGTAVSRLAGRHGAGVAGQSGGC